MNTNGTNEQILLNGQPVAINGQKNLLELIRSTGIELPTFCYHSKLSVYGACRLCIVEIDGMGVVTSCSTVPTPGMVVRTHTDQLRKMRRVFLELLLANHHQSCTTCDKSDACKLQELARQMGVTEVRFPSIPKHMQADTSSPSLVRDPNKCILCGDCVRACSEIQGIGAIDFAGRGANTVVAPAFNKDLGQVDCVNCGLCASVCPTGAIVPKSEIEEVWKAVNDPNVTVVAQIAPAVRVALGEMFGLEPGVATTGRIVAALKKIGFDKVYDTSFAADLTVLEEATEFIERKTLGKKLPLFTSCCPGWVKYAEQYYPELLPNLSSCRSPQQMFGSLAKTTLPDELKINPEHLYVVSIMPCTAKKFEAKRPEFRGPAGADVDAVLTTQELGKMIKQAGIQFHKLTPESLDMPMGFKTGAGVIFGTTGGVSEAVLRYAYEKLTGTRLENPDFTEVRGNTGILSKTLRIGDIYLKLAIVHSLSNARKIADQVKAGNCDYDLIEVMACPGGCVAGAGQPVCEGSEVILQRAKGLYEADKTLQLHKSQDNPYIQQCYQTTLEKPGSHKAHEILHTEYNSRKRLCGSAINLSEGNGDGKLNVSVCVGTGCYLRGSQTLLTQLLDTARTKGIDDKLHIKATFCFEACTKGPTVKIGDTILHKCDLKTATREIDNQLNVRA